MCESTLEQELAHVDDCKIVDSDFIRRCQMAEQQITGYQQACYNPNDITELLGAMGLKAEEWDYIKSEIGIEWLEDILKEEIESFLESKKKMKQQIQTALCLYIAVLLFGLAAILGKACANDTHQEIQTAYQQNDTAALISAAESRAISDVIEAEKQYEKMDYQFFNGDAEAYPLIVNKD